MLQHYWEFPRHTTGCTTIAAISCILLFVLFELYLCTFPLRTSVQPIKYMKGILSESKKHHELPQSNFFFFLRINLQSKKNWITTFQTEHISILCDGKVYGLKGCLLKKNKKHTYCSLSMCPFSIKSTLFFYCMLRGYVSCITTVKIWDNKHFKCVEWLILVTQLDLVALPGEVFW